MTDTLAELTEEMCAVLTQETALLDGLDLAAAVDLLPRKKAAIASLQAVLAERPKFAELDEDDAASLRACVARMAVLAEANQSAVERGLAVQMRVIQAIAQAVPRARAEEAPSYLPNGSRVAVRPPEAYAFLRRM